MPGASDTQSCSGQWYDVGVRGSIRILWVHWCGILYFPLRRTGRMTSISGFMLVWGICEGYGRAGWFEALHALDCLSFFLSLFLILGPRPRSSCDSSSSGFLLLFFVLARTRESRLCVRSVIVGSSRMLSEECEGSLCSAFERGASFSSEICRGFGRAGCLQGLRPFFLFIYCTQAKPSSQPSCDYGIRLDMARALDSPTL